MTLTQLEAPEDEPISLAEAKDHLRILEGDTSQDAWIEMCISAVRQVAEHELQRTLVSQQWRYTLDAFPEGDIELPVSPVISVESVQYVDEDGVTQTLAHDEPYVDDEYEVDLAAIPPLVTLPFEGSWPATRSTSNAVIVQFTSGYGEPNDVPAAVKQWMLLMLGHYYENREASIPGQGISVTPLPFISTLLDRYRFWSV